MRAAAPAGVRHLVFISVVGADKIPSSSAMDGAMFGYFASKAAAERTIADSGLAWTTLRATQFHDLVLKTAQGMSKLPVVPVPSGWRFQRIDAADVGDRLVRLALGTPAGLVPAVGGPRVYDMSELARGYLRRPASIDQSLRCHLPGQAARVFRDGANLAPDRAVGHRTWEEFLAERVEHAPHAQIRARVATGE